MLGNHSISQDGGLQGECNTGYFILQFEHTSNMQRNLSYQGYTIDMFPLRQKLYSAKSVNVLVFLPKLRSESVSLCPLGAVQVVRTVSTTQPCLKRTPHTVGVPAWAKATQRRRRSLARLQRPKTIEKIQAEYRLANDPTELNLYTTTRRGPVTETMYSQLDM